MSKISRKGINYNDLSSFSSREDKAREELRREHAKKEEMIQMYENEEKKRREIALQKILTTKSAKQNALGNSRKATSKCRYVAFMNHKGGVTKSTMCYVFALYLYKKGYSVLVLDMDSQSDIGVKFDVDGNSEEFMNKNISKYYENLATDFDVTKLKEIITNVRKDKYGAVIDIIPGNENVSRMSNYAEKMIGKNQLSAANNQAVNAFRKDYDFVVVDTNPALLDSIMSVHAVENSDGIVIPVDGNEAVNAIQRVMNKIRQYENKQIVKDKNYAIVAAKYQPTNIGVLADFEQLRCNIGLEPVDEIITRKARNGRTVSMKDESTNLLYRILRKIFSDEMCYTAIPEEMTLKNVLYEGLPKKYIERYDRLCEEIEEKICIGTPTETPESLVEKMKSLKDYIRVVNISKSRVSLTGKRRKTSRRQ